MTTVSVTNLSNTVVVTEGTGETTVVSAPSPAVLVETTGLGPQGPGGNLGLYASIIDTTTQSLISADTPQALTLNTIIESRGISVSNASRITFSLANTYKILASLQITNFGNAITELNIYFRKNGVNIPNSNTRIDLEPRKSVSAPYHDCFAIEYQLTVADNDYVEIYWVAGSSDVRIETIPLDAEHPQAPSAIVNVAQVMYLQLGPQGPAGPPGASGLFVDDTAKVDRSIVYYDAASATFKADNTWTTTTIVDGANF